MVRLRGRLCRTTADVSVSMIRRSTSSSMRGGDPFEGSISARVTIASFEGLRFPAHPDCSASRFGSKNSTTLPTRTSAAPGGGSPRAVVTAGRDQPTVLLRQRRHPQFPPTPGFDVNMTTGRSPFDNPEAGARWRSTTPITAPTTGHPPTSIRMWSSCQALSERDHRLGRQHRPDGQSPPPSMAASTSVTSPTRSGDVFLRRGRPYQRHRRQMGVPALRPRAHLNFSRWAWVRASVVNTPR